jgi:hypothetical protein
VDVIQPSATGLRYAAVMAGSPSSAQHAAALPHWWRIRRVLIFLLLLPVILPVSCALYIGYVPPHAASTEIEEIKTTVDLRFYWVTDENKDSGRYFTVRTLAGSITHGMCGFDWAHWARTSLYLTDAGGLAILGFHDCDYFVSLPQLTITRKPPGPSEAWRYLGAFDFAFAPTGVAGTRNLRFIPAAEQAECIAMGGSDFVQDWMTRRQARKPRCP